MLGKINYDIDRMKKMLSAISWHNWFRCLKQLFILLFYAFIFVALPILLSKRLYPNYSEKEVLSHTFSAELIKRDRDLIVKPDSTYDEPVELFVPKSPKRGFISNVLKLPEAPFDYEFCFSNSNYIMNADGERIQLPMRRIAIIFEDQEEFILGDKKICKLSGTGSNIITDPEPLYMGQIYEAFIKISKPYDRDTGVPIEEEYLLASGDIVNSEGKLIDGEWTDEGFLVNRNQFDMKMFAIQDLKITIRPVPYEIIALAVVSVTAWWMICLKFVGILSEIAGIFLNNWRKMMNYLVADE